MNSWSSLSPASRGAFPLPPVSQLCLPPFPPSPSPIHLTIAILVPLLEFGWWVPWDTAVLCWEHLMWPLCSRFYHRQQLPAFSSACLIKEYFPHTAPLLCPLFLPLPHRELQWKAKLGLGWPQPRALACPSWQVSRKIAFGNSYVARNQCNCQKQENQLPIIYLEVRCSTQGCPGEETAREEMFRVNLCYQVTAYARRTVCLRPHRGCELHLPELAFKHLAPALPLKQLSMCIGMFPWPPGFLPGMKNSTSSGALLQDGTHSSLKDSGTILQPFRAGVIFQWCYWQTSTILAPQPLS